MISFEDFFHRLVGRTPYPYQTGLATAAVRTLAVQVPTGTGKTAAVIVAWLYRRLVDPANTPRRLVYCLPMRVLVEQTRRRAAEWIAEAAKQFDLNVDVYTLMGGEVEEKWEVQPESDAILIGTQDMLLSRALNRGYAMSRYQWPVHFGLMNNDALWVCDEVQLMGSGLATTTQLAAWRDQMGTVHRTAAWWMSATFEREWLATVDFADGANSLPVVRLGQKDLEDSEIQRRWNASKPVQETEFASERDIVQRVLKEHRRGTLTLVIVNTVDRAQRIIGELKKRGKAGSGEQLPELILAHGRFRGHERIEIGRRLEAPVPEDGPGRIVIATQVIEAGVDISARALFTELAPWASMVQRFGRVNRDGKLDAAVIWMDLPDSKAKPYEADAMSESRERLRSLTDVALKNLEGLGAGRFDPPLHVVRRKDLVELFDTTPDLSGSDVDVSRFIRDGEDLDAQVFWREVQQVPPGEDEPCPSRNELCPVPFHLLQDFLKGEAKAYRWNPLEERWESARQPLPGQTYLIESGLGGYLTDLGWTGKTGGAVVPVNFDDRRPCGSYRADKLSQGVWLTVAQHTDHVIEEARSLSQATTLEDRSAKVLEIAARWHDRGKGHDEFQAAIPCDEVHPPGDWAKGAGTFRRYSRPLFRHEFASALAILQEDSGLIPDDIRDLVAYLAASHHGKVRMSIRSLPRERVPSDDRRFARGVWDGDVLSPLALGGEVMAPEVCLSLEPMELGLGESGEPSWADRMITLRDGTDWGVFRLAYLEAMLRAADRRASAKEGISA